MWKNSGQLHRLVLYFRGASAGLTSLFFPLACGYCLREGVTACLDCLALWSTKPSTRLISSTPIYSVIPYDERSTAIVLAAKERGESGAKLFLVTALTSVLERISSGGNEGTSTLIVPIPSSKRALQKRGEDFMLQLAKAATENFPLGKIRILRALQWSREIQDQSQLSLAERMSNLSGALIVDEKYLARWQLKEGRFERERIQIVIVDDVLTSGSTMAAAISAISHSSLGFGLGIGSVLLGITACHSAKPL